ncbi:ATP-dependent nuclease [Xanthomonas oryzae]|uniref:ATP-dependent nuclease n=1 Tax=Xanthomonas oryzae TaxID=347 RepID=UPI0002DBD893|nr:AAA family ATPase [Xanthomonas oryzae]
MVDLKKELQNQFKIKNRYANFGPVICEARIRGFRGIKDLAVNFESPITAISGLNGTGKSTIAQLMTNGYKKPSTESSNYKRHYISNYFPISRADPEPFQSDASVEYLYATNQEDRLQELTVSRGLGKQWDGYKRQPERHCRYIGFTIYIPKVEQRDISIYRGNEILISNETNLSENAKNALCRILSTPYSTLASATARHKYQYTDIGFAEKYGSRYSENNMGFGEGRAFYTVRSLESAPEQSLFVIEEPETSLHENAQYELAKYFIDVCLRRKHQIIITTHSKAILSALPVESRKLLYRDGPNIRVSDRTSTAEATGLLSLGMSAELTILVEDHRAKSLLIELIRVGKPNLLRGLRISFVGNDDMVMNITKQLRADGAKVKGFRDGDKGPDARNGVFSLPGQLAPEKAVLSCEKVSDWLSSEHSFRLDEWLVINSEVDFHDWPKEIALEISKSENGFWEEACAIYSRNLDKASIDALITNVERH